MRRQKLNFDNLDDVVKASPGALRKGTQQFLTPDGVAEALCMPLPNYRPIVFDPQCGQGSLLHAAAITCRYGTKRLLGVDIDPTAQIPAPAQRFVCEREVIHGDFTKILPLFLSTRAKFDLIVANPPFSLKWTMEPMHWKDVNGKLDHVPPPVPEKAVARDSTLVTFEAIHAMLSKIGEGMMICNAATADRLLAPHPLYARTWLRLDTPDFFTGVLQKMRLAILYFAASHRDGPLTISAPDAMPDTIRRSLEYPTRNRDRLIHGAVVKQAHDTFLTGHAFDAVAEEWRRLTDRKFAEANGWNIWLGIDGSIQTFLTPFQKLTGDVPKALVEALTKVQGQHPAAMVLQRASRNALRLAVKGNIWRVHPNVVKAVDDALHAYDLARAPLRPLNRVQRLGHLDEEDAIQCERPPCLAFTAGRRYPLESEIVEGKKLETRQHWRKAGEEENVLVTGRELLLRIKDDNGEWHVFTQYPLGETQESERPEEHFHLLSELVECFVIPEVPDIAQLHPKEFAEYQRRLLALEWS